jgi:nucleoid DNA-binding protein
MSDALEAARRVAKARKTLRVDETLREDLRRSRRKGRKNDLVFPSELARIVCRRTGAPREIVWPIVEEFLEVVADVLENGQCLKLRGLGTFYWKKYPRRDGFSSNLTKKLYNLPERVRLKWSPPKRFKGSRPDMEKYGVKLDDEKVKQAQQGKDKPDTCPECDKKLDSGGACPEHGTEPLEDKRG